MKRFTAALIVLIMISGIFITGCTNDENNVTDNSESVINYSTDMQITYHTTGANVPMTKSDKGYYYVGGDGIVIFVDKESKKATPLCTKPNCLHDDPESCDAYFNFSLNNTADSAVGVTHTVIQYNEGSLYMVCGEYDESYTKYRQYLLKTNTDGTNRERVTDYLEHSFTDWFIHRGYLYYTTDSSICRRPLDALKSEPEVLFEAENHIEDDMNTFHGLCAYDNYMYCIVEEKEDYETFLETYNICINLDTLEVKRLRDDNEQDISPLSFFEDKFVCISFGVGKANYQKRDLNGEKPTELFSINQNEVQTFSSDGRYIYWDNNSESVVGKADKQIIKIYDLNMNQVDSFTFEGIGNGHCNFFNPQDNEYFLLESTDDDGNRILVMADKSQIGSIGGKTIKYTELCKLDWAKDKEKYYEAAK